jgi:tetratricopeptide (TPR) repeat protein
MSFVHEARTAFRQGRTETVEQLSRAELERARRDGDVPAEVEALGWLARVAVRGGDLGEAGRLALAARNLARSTGDVRIERVPLHILAATAKMAGDLAGARALFEESIALNEALSEALNVTSEIHNLATVELKLGDVERARDLLREVSAAIDREGWDDLRPYLAISSALVAEAGGDRAEATRLVRGADAAFRAAGEIPDPDDAEELAGLRKRLGLDDA